MPATAEDGVVVFMETETNYAAPWLERRKGTEDPDPDFIARLEELFRGQQQ